MESMENPIFGLDGTGKTGVGAKGIMIVLSELCNIHFAFTHYRDLFCLLRTENVTVTYPTA